MTTITQIGIFLLCAFTAQNLHSQNLTCEWLHSFGGEQTDYGIDATSDGQGNFLISGNFSGETDIDPSDDEYILSSIEGTDAYLAKYSPNQELIWAFSIGGTSSDIIYQIKSLPDDRILICGTYSNSCDFDPSESEYILETFGYGDAFVAIYTSAGELDWVKAIGGSANTDIAWGCTSDSNSNIYFGGYFIGSADLDPSINEFPVFVPNGATPDLFLVKLSPDGEFIWGGTMAGSGLEYPYGMSVDAEQNLIVSGLIEGSIDFDLSDSEQIIDSPSGATGMNCYIAKYSQDGDLIDAKIFGGQGDDVVRTMIPTNSGYLLGGRYSGQGDFDPGIGDLNFESFGDWDAFLIQLDFDFNVIWSYNFGDEGQDSFNDLALDAFGNIVACGSFEIANDFDPTAEEYILTVPETVEGIYKDAFALILSPAGEFKEAQNFGGWNDDKGNGIAVSGSKILLLGNFKYEATSGACSATVNSEGEPYSDDVFAICFSSTYLSVGESEINNMGIYPNPTSGSLKIRSQFEIQEFKITNTIGQAIFTESPQKNSTHIEFDVSNLEQGIYFVTVQTKYGTSVQRFVKE
ncbi:MAG: T9SS type A sorting domain-containing protein [Flavobacteriales bacterium]|nr:T9SS type A sorting domain-containing protein [Flavobacteriales bacterium]